MSILDDDESVESLGAFDLDTGEQLEGPSEKRQRTNVSKSSDKENAAGGSGTT